MPVNGINVERLGFNPAHLCKTHWPKYCYCPGQQYQSRIVTSQCYIICIMTHRSCCTCVLSKVVKATVEGKPPCWWRTSRTRFTLRLLRLRYISLVRGWLNIKCPNLSNKLYQYVRYLWVNSGYDVKLILPILFADESSKFISDSGGLRIQTK